MARIVDRPPLLITPGDPAGIGPEIALKALSRSKELKAQSVLIGDRTHLSEVAEWLGQPVSFAKWTPGDPLDDEAINLAEISWPTPVVPGQPDTAHGPLIIETIETAAHLAKTGDVAAIVTCPIAKANLYQAGFRYPGHTEFLGALSDGKTPVMMLANDALRVVPATIHIPLQQVSEQLNTNMLSQLIERVTDALRTDFGLPKPRIALCGLNPHAGEDGAMGDEEQRIITPAIKQAQNHLADTAHILGPLPADTMFHAEKRRQFDCVIGMYHDQVLIPVKSIDFHGSVNVTLGLDFVRTSPDHGTAFDIAGQGIARDDSLVNALQFARMMADNRLRLSQASQG